MHSSDSETLISSEEVNSVSLKVYPSESHCRMALDAQDGCNPAGIALAVHAIAADVQRDFGTDAVRTYDPYRLLVFKLMDMLRQEVSLPIYDAAYHNCHAALVECENWNFDYWSAIEHVERVALTLRASLCPECGVPLGAPDYEPNDHSVGIEADFYVNTCPTHGTFVVHNEGSIIWDKELDLG